MSNFMNFYGTTSIRLRLPLPSTSELRCTPRVSPTSPSRSLRHPSFSPRQPTPQRMPRSELSENEGGKKNEMRGKRKKRLPSCTASARLFESQPDFNLGRSLKPDLSLDFIGPSFLSFFPLPQLSPLSCNFSSLSRRKQGWH